MFKTDGSSDLSQISLTGVRAIVLLGLLMIAPRSFEDIRKSLIDMHIMEENHSNDILRIDMNTLKAIGCDISRASAKTDSKFSLIKHPFCIDINEDEIKLIKRIYRHIKNSVSIPVLFAYDELFKKIANFVQVEKTREALLGISVLKKFNLDMLKEILSDCNNNSIVKLKYKNPSYKKSNIKEIALEKVEFQNDSIIIQGFDVNKKRAITLNFARILSIISKRKNDQDFRIKKIKLIYKLTDFGVEILRDGEIILEKHKEYFLIEGNYLTEFSAIQRILSFGDKCTVLEPTDFIEKIVTKLQEMKEGYNDEISR